MIDKVKTYELKTIDDIYREIPPEKWELCLAEILVGFKLKLELDDPTRDLFTVKRFIWIDDGASNQDIIIEVKKPNDR